MRVVGAVKVSVIFALFRAMIRVGNDALAMLLTLPRNYLLAQCVTEWQQYDGADLRESHSKGVVAVQIELGTPHHQPVSQLSSLPTC